MNSRITFLVFAMLLVGAMSAGSTLGQGGTGRETPKPPAKSSPTKPKPSTNPASRTKPTCIAQSPTQATGRTHTVNLGGGLTMELLEIPAGSFCMGSTNGEANEKPVHRVTISNGFYMGKYEVTQAQWRAVIGNNPSYFNDCELCPVEQVSWDDAENFINKLNSINDGFRYRLPTEAEWEYACRAGTNGDASANSNEMAWSVENSAERTHTVGRKLPNAWGLSDMIGNVWEWCPDRFNESYYGAPTDGSAWLSGGLEKFRVLRGGAFSHQASDLRSAIRIRTQGSRDTRDKLIGFRVVAVARAQ